MLRRAPAPPMAPLLLVVAAGCGRLHFEVQQDAGGSFDDGSAPVDGASTCAAMPFGTPVLMTDLSSPGSDGTLRLMPDELRGYFWSRRGIGDSDIYLATRADRSQPFSVLPIQGVNTSGDELDPTISSDGSVLVFRLSATTQDLYVSSAQAPDSFTSPTLIPNLGPNTESQGFLPVGRDELYYSSTQSASGDIYVASRSGTTFGVPMRILELSTPLTEGDPVVTPDGLTIYFRRNDTTTFGGFNIFTASRATPASPFGAATLLDNVNTNADDGPSWISGDNCRLYLTSDTAGFLDLYVATRGP